MNQSPTMDFLTSDERDLVAADVSDLMDDPHISVAVNYLDVGAPTFTPSTGAMTANNVSHALRAVRNVLSAREVGAAQGKYQMGDVRYLLERAHLDALGIVPVTEDRITEEGMAYEFIHFDTDPLGVVWRIVARRVA